MVSYCDHLMSVVRRQSSVLNNCFKGHLLNYWLDSAKLQMGLVYCISRSHRLKIDFQDENFKNLLLTTTKPRVLIFGM